MASQNTPTRPVSVQRPGYPVEDGYNLPTCEKTADVGENLDAILQLPDLGSDNELFREIISSEDKLLPLPHKPSNTCHRNSALAALFNVSPFLNFLNQVDRQRNERNTVLNSLKQLADTFRRSAPREKLKTRQRRLGIQMNSLWIEMTTKIQDSNGYINSIPEPLETGPYGLDDPNAFLAHLFPRIVDCDLERNQLGPDGIDLCTMFDRLFRYAAIPRTPMQCMCGGSKQRQSVAVEGSNVLEGYDLNLNFQTVMKLEEAISTKMWSDVPKTRTCTDCSTEFKANDFLKFAYLPEVFFFSINYMKFGPTGWSNVESARVDFPEILDMSQLRDDPTRATDQEHCTYKLQSMVLVSNEDQAEGEIVYGTHYVACLRRTDTVWEILDDLPYPNGEKSRVSLEDINQGDKRPHLLIYVRERPCNENKDTPEGGSIEVANNQNHDNTRNTKRKKAGKNLPGDNYEKDTANKSSNKDHYTLDRFLEAQNKLTQARTTQAEQALFQLEKGRKTGHWMWCIFPQVSGLTRTRIGTLYSIKSIAEAKAYLAHRVLSQRLREATQAVLSRGDTNLQKVFGTEVDADRFRSCMTLFAYVCRGTDETIYQRTVDRLCGGRADERTLEILQAFSETEVDADGNADEASQRPIKEDVRNEHNPSLATGPLQLAIHTDPNDERVAACQTWNLADFQEQFRMEGLEYRGQKKDIETRRARFLQHFDVERNYNIYKREKLQQAYARLYPHARQSLSRPELIAALRGHDEQVLARGSDGSRDGAGRDEQASSLMPVQGEKRSRDVEHDGDDRPTKRGRRRKEV